MAHDTFGQQVTSAETGAFCVSKVRTGPSSCVLAGPSQMDSFSKPPADSDSMGMAQEYKLKQAPWRC